MKKTVKVYKVGKETHKFKSNATIRETTKLFERVGCCYPRKGESYYIDSNIQEKLVPIDCTDGYFYGDLETAKKIAIVVE